MKPTKVRLPVLPKHPERTCWGCDRYCPADDMACGNGSERTPHPLELFGSDWQEWAAELHGGDDADRRSSSPPEQPAATASRFSGQ